MAKPAASSEGEPTRALGSVSPTIAGPAEWQGEPPSLFPDNQVQVATGPSLLVSISATALLIGVLACVIAFFAIKGPVKQIAGAARPDGSADHPALVSPTLTVPTTTSSRPQPTSTTAPTRSTAPGATPAAQLNSTSMLAGHQLSTSNALMGTTVCSLSRFDPSDDRQAVFFQEAKICADAAWGAVLEAAGMHVPTIPVITVHNVPEDTPCGQVKPTDRPTQCRATVYMTPAYLRDIEGNGRYPGRYFGVFLREYALAVQDATGLTAWYSAARSQPGAATADLDTRLAQQATCLAGVAASAMAGQGAVDTNITNEIRDRLTTVDAPADAAAWLAKGTQSRRLAACNAWATGS